MTYARTGDHEFAFATTCRAEIQQVNAQIQILLCDTLKILKSIRCLSMVIPSIAFYLKSLFASVILISFSLFFMSHNILCTQVT